MGKANACAIVRTLWRSGRASVGCGLSAMIATAVHVAIVASPAAVYAAEGVRRETRATFVHSS